MAGGDGSLAAVAAAAAAHGLPFVCVPAGTRNHFALDVGVDRHDLTGSSATEPSWSLTCVLVGKPVDPDGLQGPIRDSKIAPRTATSIQPQRLHASRIPGQPRNLGCAGSVGPSCMRGSDVSAMPFADGLLEPLATAGCATRKCRSGRVHRADGGQVAAAVRRGRAGRAGGRAAAGRPAAGADRWGDREILAATVTPPPESLRAAGVTHWSSRRLADWLRRARTSGQP